MRIAFVGCGAAGRPLGIAWRKAGHTIGAVLARRTAAEAVGVLGEGIAGGSLDDADVVVFATPDDALASVAARFPLAPSQIALHLSGAHPSTVLAPTGARTAGLHPLRAFAELATSLAALPKTHFFVEGEAVDVAERLAKDLGGTVARIATDRKILYHAGATTAGNYTVTLLSAALDMLHRAGVADGEALPALLSLVRGALDNVERVGVAKGLTGPCARGDVDLIRRHMEALPPPSRALYAELLRATIPIARAKGALGAEAARELSRLMEAT